MMKSSRAVLSLALLILFFLYSAELVLIKTRLHREVTRLSRGLRYFEEANSNAAKLFFASTGFKQITNYKITKLQISKIHPGLYPTSYSELGIPKGSGFPPLAPTLRPEKVRLGNGVTCWVKTRWIYRDGTLWAETLGSSQRWPRSPEVPGAPIFGVAAPVSNELLVSANSRMSLLFNAARPGGLSRLASQQVSLPDHDPSAPTGIVRYKVGSWTHFSFFFFSWILVMIFLRILKARQPKPGKREAQLEEELAYLSKTYQNLSRSLRVERQKVEAILNSAPDGIFTCSPEGIVTFWNRSMEALTKLPKDTAVGKHYRESINIFSAQGQRLADPFSVSFDQQKTLSLLDCQIEVLSFADSNGISRVVPVSLGVAPVTAIDGPVEEIVVTVKDIRIQKEAEHLREDMQAMITHDLRSPLTAMLGYAGLIQNAKICKNEEDAQKYLDSLVRSGKEMLILISNLLRWSWVEEGKFSFQKEPLQVSPILKEAVDGLGVLAKPKQLSIAVGAPDDLWALTDGDKFKEILNNLITNAIKFSRPGGTIRVSAEAVDSRVRISVADQGPGIPSEERENLFKKFSNLRKPGSGTGLGLYIVKTLAEALDGSVDLESEVGRGSTFSILLPAYRKVKTHSEQLSFVSLVATAESNPAGN